MKHWPLLGAVAALQIADGLTTYYGLQSSWEGNPVGDWAFQVLGFWPAMAAYKGAVIAAAFALLYYVPTLPVRKGILYAMGIMLVIVLNNAWALAA